MSIQDIFTPVFTDAGLAAVAAADGQGLSVAVAEIAFGDALYAVRDASGNPLGTATQMTTLSNELLRLPLSAGSALDSNQILVEALVSAGTPTFWIGEVGFFLSDGTLLAVASHASDPIGWRGDLADWVFRFVLAWSDLPPDAITVTYSGDAAYAALSADHEQVEAKVRHTVESEGLTWVDADDTQLTAAVNAKVAAVDISGKADADLGNLTGWSVPDSINATFGGTTYAGGAKFYVERPETGGVGIYGYNSDGPGIFGHSQSSQGVTARTHADNASVLYAHCMSTSFTHCAFYVEVKTVGSGYDFAKFDDYNGSGNSTLFRFRGDGVGFQDGGTAWSTPADYAERFETTDGLDIPVGTTVVLDAGKVRAAMADDPASDVIGVVRPKGGDGSIVGNDGSLRWQGMWQRDDYGAFVLTEDGARVLNPDYDPDQPYTPRSERPEWVLIGLLGQVPITKGQPVGERWVKIRDISDGVEEWFVR